MVYRIVARVDWQGDKFLSKLNKNAIDAVEEATKIYREELRTEMGKTWGSRIISGILRFRFQHSVPGSPPFMQTANLIKSIRLTFTKRTKNFGIFVGRVSTRVKYASVLERGGGQNVSIPQGKKRFTPFRLVNPLMLKAGIFIAARPVWLPVFLKVKPKMLTKIIQIMKRK